MRLQALQLLDMNGIAGSQTPPDSVQLAVTAFFVAQVLAPLGRSVLARKHRGRFQIRPGLDQMVQDLDYTIFSDKLARLSDNLHRRRVRLRRRSVDGGFCR